MPKIASDCNIVVLGTADAVKFQNDPFGNWSCQQNEHWQSFSISITARIAATTRCYVINWFCSAKAT